MAPVDLKDPREIKLGKFYMVKRKDNTWMPGEVVSKRYNKKHKCIEYYVNYKLLDRRNDEWVRGYRIGTGNSNEKNLPVILPRVVDGSDSDESLNLEEEDPGEKEHKELTKVKYINTIQFGNFEIDTWYYSPYPETFDVGKIYVCTRCFKYMCRENTYIYHLPRCEFFQPPGDAVYSKDSLTIFEVDGAANRLYCQNLSLLGKLFIDHKTICFDVESFLYYILCSQEPEGYIIKGYFSKEKETVDGFNLSCIMTLPPFQKQGFGKLLIDFSYQLSIIQAAPGSPEGPISDLGLFTYRSYWSWRLLKTISGTNETITISELSKQTGISEGDIVYTLSSLKLLSYWKGPQDILIKYDSLKSIIASDKYKEPRLIIDDSLITWKYSKYSKRK